MKKRIFTLVSALLLGASAFAQTNFYQTGIITVMPTGATASQPITITFHPENSCQAGDANKTLVGNPTANMHSGLSIGGSWTNGVDWNAGPQTNFTLNNDGSFSLTLTPETYFNVDAATAASADGFFFVVNGAANQSDPSPWAREGKAINDINVTPYQCENFYVPFPIPSSLATSAKQNISLKGRNYPNPVYTTTNISYNTYTKSNVKVNVLNAIGQEVRVLANETQAAGQHEITWDGNDANGIRVSPGIYFFSINTGTVTESHKMIVVR